MALTGLQIFKLLPKKNCKECGVPTCLAFAMKLAQKQASLNQCPYVSEEAKEELAAASQPPVKLVKIGKELEIGNETVLYRHEETFYHPTGVAVKVKDDMPDAELDEKLDKIAGLTFDRVGRTVSVDLVAVENSSGDAAKFAAVAGKAVAKTKKAAVLISASPEALKAAGKTAGDRPLLYISDPSRALDAAAVAKELNCPLAVRAEGLDALAELTPKIREAGVEEIVLDAGTTELRATVEALTSARRLALKNFRPLGYPTIAFVNSDDPHMQVVEASTCVAKYAGVVVMDGAEKWQVLPVLTTRMDIYTDPQTPAQVEAGLHKVGDPDDNSPVLITTNFSLTYYSVEGEVEASRVPSHILVVDTEGTSVLTAWASDKFNAESIAATIKKAELEGAVKHRKVVLPGYVAVLSGGVEDESGWKVAVGPKEASGIPNYLKNQWKPD